jgi:pimeloyl-ACP methyl ester carboxylesterase
MRYFNSSGVSIAYIDVPPHEGQGDPILLIHGFASNHAVNWVNTLWVKTLTRAGYRVVAFDNRGHGQSEKLYDPEAYNSYRMAEDGCRLLDHLGIEKADVMGYSMGARITAHMALTAPERMRSMLLGGLGIHLVEGVGLPLGIADAMEVRSLDDLTDPMQRMFRAFAEQTGSDLKALADAGRGRLHQAADPGLGRHQGRRVGLGAGTRKADPKCDGARYPGAGSQPGRGRQGS